MSNSIIYSMNIITLHHYHSLLNEPMRISRGGLKSRHHLIIEISVNEVSGYGEAICSSDLLLNVTKSLDLSELTKIPLSDFDAFLKSYLDQIVYFEGLSVIRALFCALSAAALDCLARLDNLPFYKYISPSPQNASPLESYASNIYWKENPDEMNDDIKYLIDKGVKNIKAHVGVLEPEDELRRLDTLTAISNCSKFMLDFNCAYNENQAHSFISSSSHSNHDFYWLEELVRPDDLSAIVSLASLHGPKLAFGENHYGRQFNFLADQGVGFLMPDIGRSLFILDVIELSASLTDSYISLHNYSSGILLSASVHLSHVIGEKTIVETDQSSNALITEFLDYSIFADNNSVIASSSNGIGCSLPLRLGQWKHDVYKIAPK